VARALAGAGGDALYVGGGGARNAHLMARLAQRLAPMPVQAVDALGLPAEAKEAADFAVLGLEAVAGSAVALPAVTGAAAAALAGCICLPPAQRGAP
jgi:anhydro-N-acetylmuramic acid kinase